MAELLLHVLATKRFYFLKENMVQLPLLTTGVAILFLLKNTLAAIMTNNIRDQHPKQYHTIGQHVVSTSSGYVLKVVVDD